MEFEITLKWRYKPDPHDYANSHDELWDIDPLNALAVDLDNIERSPGAHLPSNDDLEVTGRILSDKRVKPCPEGFRWIEGDLARCSECRLPIYEHAGFAVLKEGFGPYDPSPFELRPFTEEERTRYNGLRRSREQQ